MDKEQRTDLAMTLFSGVRTLFAGSKCLDLVITDAAGTIVSGHFDKKIRTWDNLADQCRHEFTCNASVTSLSYNMGSVELSIKGDLYRSVSL